MRGLAEYCAVNESMVVEMPKGFHSGDKQLEAPICAFDATRIWVAHERCHDELKRMPDAERRLAKDLNERMGFKGDGVLVVYGEGCVPLSFSFGVGARSRAGADARTPSSLSPCPPAAALPRSRSTRSRWPSRTAR